MAEKMADLKADLETDEIALTPNSINSACAGINQLTRYGFKRMDLRIGLL